MVTLQQRLRDPKLIKLAVLATAILAISIGIGVSVGGRGRSSVSSSSEDALGKYASGKVGEIIEPDSETTNVARYYGNGYTDYTSATTTTIRGGSGIDNAGDWSDDGWSSEGGMKSSTTTSKCDKGGSYTGVEVSSSAKAGKTEGRTRRLGSAWASSSVWSPSGGVKAGSTTTSMSKSEKTVKTTGSAISKSEKTEEVSEETILYEDVDCETTVEVVVASKASSSKALKTKSSKVKKESSAKGTSATVASSWERSPPADVSNVWGSSPITSPAPTSSRLESLAPVQASSSVSLCHELMCEINR
jgi:hypothetical protein